MIVRFAHAVAAIALLCGCSTPSRGRRWIDDIRLRGVDSVDEDALREGLALHETGWWPFAEKRWFDPADLDIDVARIRHFYAAKGFFEAKVVERRVEPDDDGRSVDVVLRVREGPKTRITGVTLRGFDELPADVRARLTRDLGLAPGQRFDHARYLGAKRELLRRLRAASYVYAEVEGRVAVDRDKRQAAIELTATPGPRARHGPVSIEGNGPIPGDKLERMVRWKRGQLYSAEDVAATRQRLLGLGVFSSVNIPLPPTPTPRVPMTIHTEVGKLRELRLGGGLGVEQRRQQVRLSARWTWRNFLGGLRLLRVKLEPSYVVIPSVWDAARHGPAIDGEIRLEQPDIFSTAITAFVALRYRVDVQPGYRVHGPGAQLGVDRYLLDELLRVSLSWNFEYADFFDVDKNAFDPTRTQLGLGFVDPYRLGWLEPFAELDLRDARVDPRAGFYALVRFEGGSFAFGSQFTYLKIVPDLRGYIPLGTKRIVLALRARLGYLRPIDPEDSPITRRLYLGGPSSHRGFSYGRLSPQRYDATSKRYVPLGGNASLLLSSDLRLRLVELAGNWLSLSSFFDAGDCVASFDQLALDELHLAVGGGIYYKTPVGTVRFAVGVRLNRLAATQPDGRQNPDPVESTIDRLAFHFTIGEAF